MNQELFDRIVKLLTPRMEEDRRTPVTSAFSGYTALYNSINWDGAADEFTVRLVQKFKTYGEVEPGYPALVKLLQAIYNEVGIGDRYEVYNLSVELAALEIRKLNTEYNRTSAQSSFADTDSNNTAVDDISGTNGVAIGAETFSPSNPELQPSTVNHMSVQSNPVSTDSDNIAVDDIKDANGVAIGTGAQTTVNHNYYPQPSATDPTQRTPPPPSKENGSNLIGRIWMSNILWNLSLIAVILTFLFTDIDTKLLSWLPNFTPISSEITEATPDITLITEAVIADSVAATLTAQPTITTPSTLIPTITSTPANAVTCPNSSCGENRLRNGDFEQSLEFWEGKTNAEIVPGRTGQGAQVKYDINRTNGEYSNIHQNLPGTFEQGRWYWAETWCKAQINEKCKIFLGDANHEFGTDFQNEIWRRIDGNGKWQRFGVSLYLSQEEKLNLYIYNEEPSWSVIYDDIRVEEIFCDTDHICNGGFEKGDAHWNFESGSHIISPGYKSESALHSIQKRPISETAVWEGIRQEVTVDPKLTYMFGGYVDAGNAIEPHIKVEWLDSQRTVLPDISPHIIVGTISEVGTWSLWGERLKVPNNARFARVFAWHGVANRKNATESTFRVDNLFFQPNHELCPAKQLCNPSFEIGSTFGWRVQGKSSIVPDSNHGEVSLKSVQRPSTDKPFWAGPSQYIDVSADQNYDVSVWLKWDVASKVHAKVNWYDVAGERILSEDRIYTARFEHSNGWVQGSKNIRSPADAAVAQISMLHGLKDGQNDTGSTLWIDNVTFIPKE